MRPLRSLERAVIGRSIIPADLPPPRTRSERACHERRNGHRRVRPRGRRCGPKGFAARRTFAIISHPDAGKTTLTEKLLLAGGAINMAGAVKARGENRRARSDWMEIEQFARHLGHLLRDDLRARGITFNLLDTPGHSDFPKTPTGR